MIKYKLIYNILTRALSKEALVNNNINYYNRIF